jgi:hypothetical protein
MYGTTFTGLFSINSATGHATSIGNYANGVQMNALVGNGTGLLGAAFNTNSIYTIANPATSATFTSTGVRAPAAGDLAFSGATLYEVAVRNGVDALLNVTTNTFVGNFTIGNSTESNVFGLVDDGTTMFAVQGTDIYTVNLATGALTLDSNYANNRGLGAAIGAAFVSENVAAVPEPSTWAMMILGFCGVGLMAYRRKLSGLALRLT